jgi:hypothetical protein
MANSNLSVETSGKCKMEILIKASLSQAVYTSIVGAGWHEEVSQLGRSEEVTFV